MARKPLTYKRCDLERAIASALKMGLVEVKTEIARDGAIVLWHVGERPDDKSVSVWDEVYHAPSPEIH